MHNTSFSLQLLLVFVVVVFVDFFLLLIIVRSFVGVGDGVYGELKGAKGSRVQGAVGG